VWTSFFGPPKTGPNLGGKKGDLEKKKERGEKYTMAGKKPGES